MPRVEIYYDRIQKFLDEHEKEALDAAHEGAEIVAEAARRNLERLSPGSTGKLASQIEVKPLRGRGGSLVIAQGPGNYHRYYAIHVELGTHKMGKMPYLRPALRRRKALIHRLFLSKLNAKANP